MNRKESKSLASLIEHTLLSADATKKDIIKLCEEAREYGFASVCVNPANVRFCAEFLIGTKIKVSTVIAFPLGASTTAVKVSEARDAINSGADELDMVINIGAAKSGDFKFVLEELHSVREATRGRILKVILENVYLTDIEKVEICAIAKKVGADFLKTSTGFGPGGATAHDIELMRKTVGTEMGIKASGGIKTSDDAYKMIAVGATRIGTSSSVAIVTSSKK